MSSDRSFVVSVRTYVLAGVARIRRYTALSIGVRLCALICSVPIASERRLNLLRVFRQIIEFLQSVGSKFDSSRLYLQSRNKIIC